jgi:hypothetical protein
MAPKILKMPKARPKAEKGDKHGAGRHPPPVSKTSAMAEIILFPNGKNEVPFLSGPQTDPESETRWLRLADEALDGKRKKA